MARVTVEDCLSKVDNRFSLVIVASRRARQLAMGYESLLPWEQDKPTVMALREIAENKIDPETIMGLPVRPKVEPVIEVEDFSEDMSAPE